MSAWHTTTDYMEQNYHGYHPDHPHMNRQYQSRSCDPVCTSSSQRNAAWQYEQQQQQQQQQKLSSEYRPHEWHDGSEGPVSPIVLTPLPNVRPFRQFQQQIAQPAQPLRPRGRPERFSGISGRQEDQQRMGPTDPTLLYPQMSPYDPDSSYDNRDGRLSAPRAISQPVTPNLRCSCEYGEETDEALNAFSRLSIAPLAPRRRPHTVINTPEAPFTDEEEFRLFVQATAGLGPASPMRGSPIVTATDEDRRRHTVQSPSDPAQLASPLQQTPTTLLALQHMAQMPQQAFTLPRRPAEQRPAAQPIHASDGGLNLWAEPGRRDANGGDVSPVEEELPGYAESQAQAQAVQATEARRRAQELARRWHAAHG
ncbi:hypothetical protein CERZMDRAFT_84610 [Cercospora zeae-maydis SCOH1-5]|uniref:Uncharacterized protein n=1 Tax=Cercospora zeae-maydis SCOH1-5 TaxID=717836 RepID=A0A6A6FFR0_9PEZI|nr:hypothetical protein CERZMDRAFT_84610 [Cercospora zeae-maydis SCOH1-5]